MSAGRISKAIKLAEAKQKLLITENRRESPLSLRDWLYEVNPGWCWEWPMQAYIRGMLDKVTSGQIRKLMIFAPPRHGKSELGTIRYPVYRLEKDPTLSVLVFAHTQKLASNFGRKSLGIAENRIEISKSKATASDWETRDKGFYSSRGVLGIGGGVGYNLIIGDDPIKNRLEANSKTYRDRLWDSYKDDIYTRLEPGGAMILTYTRWHPKDMAGRILESDDGPNWTVVRLPALAQKNDPLGRPIGKALNPDRYNEQQLAEIKMIEGRSFEAVYQQNPTNPEGEFFSLAHFSQFLDVAPVCVQRVRYWDKAGTEDGGARTAGTLMGRTADGRYVVLDVVKGQWSAGKREAMIRATAEKDGRSVHIWVEQEPGSGGKESAENTIKNLAGYVCKAETVSGAGDKTTRAEPLQAQSEAGNVYLVRGPYIQDFLAEVETFPKGEFKDQIDAAAGAFNKLSLKRPAGEAVSSNQGPIMIGFGQTDMRRYNAR